MIANTQQRVVEQLVDLTAWDDAIHPELLQCFGALAFITKNGDKLRRVLGALLLTELLCGCEPLAETHDAEMKAALSYVKEKLGIIDMIVLGQALSTKLNEAGFDKKPEATKATHALRLKPLKPPSVT